MTLVASASLILLLLLLFPVQAMNSVNTLLLNQRPSAPNGIKMTKKNSQIKGHYNNFYTNSWNDKLFFVQFYFAYARASDYHVWK